MAKKKAKAHVKDSKQAKPETAKKSNKSNTGLIVGLVVLAVIIVAAAFFFLSKNQGAVIAVVNGEKIYDSEVTKRFDLASAGGDSRVTKELILNNTILERMMIQEAKKEGISVTDDELNAFIDEFLTTYGMTKDQYMEQLKQKNINYDEFTDILRTGLTIDKLYQQKISDVQISEDEILDFYNQNKQFFQNETYSDMKDQISEFLSGQKKAKEFQNYVDQLKAGSDIQIIGKTE